MKKGKVIGIIAAILLAVIFLVAGSSNILIDIKWFDNLGYTDVYFKKFYTVIGLMVPMFIVLFIVIWAYYRSIKKSIGRLKFIREVNVSKDKLEKKIFIFSNILVSLFISFSIARGLWDKVLQFTNASDFGIKDPLYNMDLSFFMFKLPLIETLHSMVTGIVFFLILVTVVVFFFSNIGEFVKEKAWDLNDFKKGFTKFAGKQVAVLALIFFINMAFGFLIRSWNLLYSERGVAIGASYTDVNVTRIFLMISAVIALITSIVVFIGILRSKYKLAGIFIIVLFLTVPLEGIAAGVVQKLVVDSNGIRLEKPYIEKNIEFTRRAYGLDKIENVDFNINNTLDYGDIKENQDMIDNIKILSFAPTLEYYRQSQYIKRYYTFSDVDIDRYTINGKYSQVFVAPREIDVNLLGSANNKWQNEHIFYTHGYGVVMNKVNELTEGRDPVFIMNNIPQRNKTGIELTNPRIYFGEKTNQYVIVNTDLPEIDYPGIDENVNIKYDGEAGIKMTFFNKLLFALKEGEMKFLLSKDVNSESRILINRNIKDRVRKIAPFLKYDQDPYMFIDNGQLYWMVDAYTTSNRYPFSEKMKNSNLNYIRNSVKVVVDAYTGEVKFYIVDKEDPIAQTYAKIFPDMFEEEVPAGIKAHYRYPSDIFQVQSDQLGKYHVTNVDTFIKNEDLWEIAKDGNKVEQEENLTDPVYMVMKLPGQDDMQMNLINYFNVKNKANMVGMLAGQMEGEDYGKLKLLRFNSSTENNSAAVYSPSLFNKKVNQDVTISKELTLLDDKGSEVIYGDTMIFPIKDSLLYVEPVYLRAKGEKSIPQMRFIIVAYKDRIVKGDTLDEALRKLFRITEEEDKKPEEVDDNKDDGKDSVIDLNGDKQALVKEANRLFKESEKAIKNGDWSKYGELMEQLGLILDKLDSSEE